MDISVWVCLALESSNSCGCFSGGWNSYSPEEIVVGDRGRFCATHVYPGCVTADGACGVVRGPGGNRGAGRGAGPSRAVWNPLSGRERGRTDRRRGPPWEADGAGRGHRVTYRAAPRIGAAVSSGRDSPAAGPPGYHGGSQCDVRDLHEARRDLENAMFSTYSIRNMACLGSMEEARLGHETYKKKRAW